VSTSVNIVKVATGIAAAISHFRFGNIDRKLVIALALPGMAGALVGATLLSSLNGAALRPALAGLLVLIGLRILFRFARLPAQLPERATGESPPTTFNGKGLHLAAACGGVTNGMIGAWGPVVTPTTDRPRRASDHAVAAPMIPPPTTITSTRCTLSG
jgi:uncharacterized membrane protein YfcA